MATERKIGAHTYRCEKLPASEGLKLLFRVSQMFRAAPGMLAGVAAGNFDKQASGQLLGLVLSEETDGEAAHQLIVELAEMCHVGSDQCVVGVKPAELLDLARVAWFVVEVQFKDFLADSLAGT